VSIARNFITDCNLTGGHLETKWRLFPEKNSAVLYIGQFAAIKDDVDAFQLKN